MHTTMKGNTRFIHNGDFSGDVEIATANGLMVNVPIRDIVLFVAAVQGYKIRVALEEMSDVDLLMKFGTLM